MDTPLHSRDKETVQTVCFWKWTGSEGSEYSEIGRQGDGHGFSRCTRNHLHLLLGKSTNDNWNVLCVAIAPVKRKIQEKTSSFDKEEDPLPSRQCTGVHLHSSDGQNYVIKIRIITTSTILTGFGPQWLPQSNEEVIAQTDAYFEDLPKSYFLDGLKKLEKRLEKCIELKGDYVEK